MRLLTLISIIILVFLCYCKRKEDVDTKGIDFLISVTDSLLNEVKDKSDITSNHFYSLIDDSLKIDSISRYISLPDSLGIYQFIELNMNDFNELIAETNSEIFFTKDQLNSIKSDFVNASISESEYKQDLAGVEDMMYFLKLRVDSNLYLIDSRYNSILFSIKDTLH